jgi:signal transduction histidine kinase
MLDIVLESIRALTMGAIVGYLWKMGKKKEFHRQSGWLYVFSGFALIFFGGVIDLTDNFESLNRFVIIGDTEAQAMLEKVVGYLLGFCLLAVGLWKWLPTVAGGSGAAEAAPLAPGQPEQWPRKWMLTILFAVTAIIAIPLAAIIVNRVVGDLAEGDLIQLAEENTLREARHVQSMTLRMLEPADGATPGGATMETGETRTVRSGSQPISAALALLAGPQGLPGVFEALVQGFNVARLSLLDLKGGVVWSSDPNIVGTTGPETRLIDEAVKHGIASEFMKDNEMTDFRGVTRRVDVMEMYLPIPDAVTGEIVGVIKADRDVSSDITVHVEDAKWAVLWTTIVTMGGLFLILFGFILVADVTISRSRRRELSIAEEANQTLEERVRQRTRELEVAQDQLVRTSQLAAIGQLAGGVAHDLRSPLGAINNAVYYLKRRLASSELAQSNPKIGQFLGIIGDEVQHSNQIITDLMDFAQGKPSSVAPTDLTDVVERTISELEPREGIHIETSFEPEMPEVLGDGQLLRRVFVNLTINAMDAMPEGGRLTITGRRVDGFAELSFGDTGVGIEEQNLNRLFDPLFTTKIKGTGLGLSICSEIVKQHQGTIDVASTPGKGTTFTIRFPVDAGSKAT